MKRDPRWRSIAAAAVAAIAAALATIPPEPAAAQPAGFDDVPEEAYFAVPVAELAARGVFAGTECDDGFCPSAPIDRKTMAVWITRVLDGEDPPPITESRFDDVRPAGFHAPFIERMAELEITRGCGDGSGFCPDRRVTRAQMAVFLSRAYMLPDGPDPGFDDVAGEWYADYVAKLAASGITAGCKDGAVFCPGTGTTRGQMATFLHRAENYHADRAERTSFSIEEGPRGNDTLISASRGRTCAVRLDGGVSCWGTDGLRDRFALAGLQNVTAVSSSYDPNVEPHVCALHEGGTISCWGSGRDGQLGQGDTNNYYLPVTVPGITDAVTASAGAYHTCAAHRDGGVSCWGSNLLGQLGTSTPGPSYSPQRVPGLSDVVAVTAGANDNCAVHRDGSVSCWGSWYTNDRASPAPRRFNGPEAMTSVAMGWSHDCATGASGAVYCWHTGQTPADGLRVGTLTDVVEVSVGYENACALHRDGGVSCWGENIRVGPEGRITTIARYPPARIAGVADAVAVSVSPGELVSPGALASPDQTAVNAHACVLHEDGSASCWGANDEGQLGDGTTDHRQVPTRAQPVVTVPADQAPAMATELLRTWVDALVQEREAEYPWLRVAWDHARDGAEVVQSGFGGMVFTYCYASAGVFGCGAEDMHMTSLSADGVVHELMHVFDLHTGLAPSTLWGAVQLYFAATHPGCWSDGDLHGAEILADTVAHVMVPGAWLTYYNSPGCPTVPEGSEPTAEAERVVLQGMAGQVPDWYRENVTNGAELWAAWLRGPSLPALANLKDEFGGLCSTDWITYPLNPGRFPPAGSNPFRDSGCQTDG